MSGFDGKNRWVCPNDRELTLRAKLFSGWSVKSNAVNSAVPNSNQISEGEQEAILSVLRRAQQTDQIEKDRIDRLVDRLNNMKRNAKGDGRSRCALCNDEFGLFAAHHTCKDCLKAVCSKCGVDTFTPENETVWFCKICSETREMWKKSGAWFFNSLPTFPFTSVLPKKGTTSRDSPSPSPSGHPQEPSSGHSSQLKSTQILSSSPVIRRKARSPSPRNYRHALTSNGTAEGCTSIGANSTSQMNNSGN